ncbi:MAG: M23 family metallopeptidase, partial [Proteobacteria bacterium]|nr:M23 family metallopeptidase [Pseudomonadota bacterium]
KKTVLTSDFDASLNIDTRLIVAGAAEIAGSLGVESADAVAANNWNSYSSDTIKGFNITKNAISIPVTTLSTYITNSDYTSQDALYTTAKNYNILYNLAYNPNIKATDLAGEGNLISYNSNQLNQSSDASTAEGFYDRTKDTAAINIDSNTTNSQLAGTLAHEGVHRDFNLSGQSYTNSEEISAHLVGDFTTSAWDSFQSDNTTLRASLPDSNINTNNYANNVVFGELVNPLRDASLVQGMKENYNNFGPRWKNPVTNKSTQTPVEGQTPREHQGNDLAAPKGSIINSAFDGKVTDSRVINGYGNTVVVEGKDPTTGNKIWALYGHMSEPSQLTVGTSVLEGQKIGLVGNTGSSSEGNHLHFGINTGNSSGNIDFKNGWTNPSVKNFGKYENLRDTPAYQKGKSQ